MAESFSRWESDPLFSAAEVVQDSADRMESVFRMLLHEQKLLQGNPSDTKLLRAVQFQRRDLVTSLETTRWQLEDFERAVNLAALSDQSSARENTIFKFRQFIRAIREQIVQVERSVDLPLEDLSRNSQSMNLNEQDADGLALFLSGDNSRDHHLHYDSGNSIMRRFLDSATERDEIVELKTEEVELLPMNGLKYSGHCYDSSEDHMREKFGSNYFQREIEAPASIQGSFGEVKCRETNAASGSYDLEFGDPSAKCYHQKNRIGRSLWRFLSNFWLANKSKGSFTKRRKDGEVIDDLAVDARIRNVPSTVSISPAEQGRYLWIGWIPCLRICEGSRVKDLISDPQFYSWLEAIRKRFQRSQYVILYSRSPICVASAILVTLAVLGFLVLHFA